MDWLKIGVLLALFGASGCGDGSDDQAGSQSGSGTEGGETTDDPATMSGDDSPTAEGSASDDSGPPPGDPELEPGSCGWAGGAFACGWAPSPDQQCAPGTLAGGDCESQTPACCLDDGTLMTCDCRDNACAYLWYQLDCTSGPGAGPCGWTGEAYQCGGNGEDPGGTPIECPADLTNCDTAVGATCCDADGNAALCSSEGTNGNPYWAITDCVLDD